jgi:putative ABC transport system permease protein
VVDALPALVSRSFAQLNNVETGHQFDLFIDNTELWFEVSGIVDYYPTLYSDEQPFVVVEQGPFLQRLQRQPGATTFPNEIWIDLEEGTSPEDVLVSLDAEHNASEIIASHRRDAVRSTLATDPLVVGLIGLLFFSFLVGIALSVVSLTTYASLTVQARRAELSVLRAIGLSPDRITLSIAIEQSLVMLTAVVLGMLIGALLSTQVLPALSRNTTGADVTPPFLITFGAVPLIIYVLITLLILLVALGFSALLVRRLTSAESLRQVEV